MSKYAFRVRIYVEADSLETDPTLGLANNVFSWVAGGAVDTLATAVGKHGILAKDFIDSIKKSVNIKRHGDIANIDGFNLKLDNTEKFWTQIIAIWGDNVSLHGSKVTVEEVTYNGVSYDYGLLYTGYCDLPSFDKSTYSLPVRGNGDIRKSKLGVVITEDSGGASGSPFINIDEDSISSIVPLSFGSIRNAKFLSYVDAETVINSTNSEPIGLTNYPVWTDDGVFSFRTLIAMGEDDSGIKPTDDYIEQLNSSFQAQTLYIKFIRGDGEGQIRRVNNITYTYTQPDPNTSIPTVIFTFAFQTPLSLKPFGLIDTVTDSQVVSWVEFYDIRSSYKGEFWKSEGFFVDNDISNTVNENFPIRIYDKTFEDIGRFSLSNLNSNNLSNEIYLTPSTFVEDTSKLVSYEISQDAPLEENTDPRYMESGYTYNSTYHVWTNGAGDVTLSNGSFSEGNTSLEDTSSPYVLNFRASNFLSAQSIFHSSRIDIPKNIDSSNNSAYLILLVNMFMDNIENVDTFNASTYFRVKKQRWKEGAEVIYEEFTNSNFEEHNLSLDIQNFPPAYSDSGIQQFPFWSYEDLTSFGSNTKSRQIYGYLKIPMDFSDFQDRSFNQAITLEAEFRVASINTAPNGFDCSLSYGAVGFAFEEPKDIDKEIYTNFKGRLWDAEMDTGLGWTTNAPVEDPIGMLGHVKLLQDYSNEGESSPTGGWGKAYLPSYIQYLNVDGDTVGSFAHQDLQTYRNRNVGHQTLKESESDSKSMARKLCQQFFLISWTNAEGKECVAQTASKSEITPSVTLTQAEMISVSKRVEMDSRDIFTEPFINYQKNFANDKYSQSAKITRTSENLTLEEDKASAVLGLDSLSNQVRAELWDKARALYLYYGVINEAPKVLTNNDYIANQYDAYWYLDEWLTFMGSNTVGGVGVVTPRNFFNFVVPYEVGRTLDIGQRIFVNVPNITDGQNYEALIYAISKDISKDMPTVSLSVVLYDLATADQDGWQDTTDESIDPQTQDTYDELEDNIQDEV